MEKLAHHRNLDDEIEATQKLKHSSPSNTARKPKTEPMKDSDYDSVPDTIVDESEPRTVVYQKNEELGTGGFAKVFRVTNLYTGRAYADKITSIVIFKRRTNAKEKIEREILIHKSLDHPNIVQFHKYFHDSSYIHMILEICINKTLLHVLKYRTTITEPEARYYLKQIMEGTRYLHTKKILHRDLKLGNMFIHADMTVKIGDFGLASTFSNNKTGSMCGTPNYIAPEVLSKKGHGVQSDIWAIGCMLFALLCGNPPFETESLNSTYKKILKADFSIPSNFTISNSARKMMEMMLARDCESRGHLAMPTRYQDDSEDLFLQPFMQEFTPRTLPRSAIRNRPDFEKEMSQLDNFSRSSAMPITNRRLTFDSSGIGSLSPTFSPPQIGSAIKQKFGSFFEKRGKFLQRVMDELTLTLETESKPSSRQPPVHNQPNVPVFVSKWVDYSNKFGFGFQLSNKAFGLLFNDKTKIGCTEDRGLVEFLDLKGKTFTFPLNGPVPYASKDLTMRVKLLECMINYMENNLHDSGVNFQNCVNAATSAKSILPQMKRWNRRNDSVAMELNNHVIQINHKINHTKVIIYENFGDLMVTILEKHQPITTYSVTCLPNFSCPARLARWLQASLIEIKHLAEKD